ncbi:hypothetical protein [Sphingobacterium sp. LRF_L2]|uniref:hypothetical protein n=1 Tax=Sphingobacterium sp. LRF_L2 TaxID=3369421 RepID=UPI003F5FBF96
MNIQKPKTLRYALAYRLSILGILLLFIATIFYLYSHYQEGDMTLEKSFFLLVIIFFLVIHFMNICIWKALVDQDGCTIFLPSGEKKKFIWKEGHRVIKTNSSVALCSRLDDFDSDIYCLSRWIRGKEILIDSYLVNLKEESCNELEEADPSLYIREVPLLGESLLLAHPIQILASTIALFITVLIFVCWSFGLFFDSLPLFIFFCVSIAAQIHMLVDYGDRKSFLFPNVILGSTVISILLFAVLMYNVITVESELFFLKWGAVFALFMTLSLYFVLNRGWKKILLNYALVIYPALFVLFTIYCSTALKVGNMIDSAEHITWEKATANRHWLVYMPGIDPDEVVFDNEKWGTRLMGLFFLKAEDWEHSARVEIKISKGRLGMPWFYEGHRTNENARIIAN